MTRFGLQDKMWERDVQKEFVKLKESRHIFLVWACGKTSGLNRSMDRCMDRCDRLSVPCQDDTGMARFAI